MLGPAMGSAPPQQLADTMHAAWVAYDIDRRAAMRVDTASKVVDDPRAVERALWDGVR